jgi:MerR family copper efflux transcriptional regulator
MPAHTFNISSAAKASGVSAKMIRYYEQLGIVPRAQRTLSNYRSYSQSDVHTLQFVRQARDLGFSLTQIQALVALWQDRRRPSRKVKELAQAHIEELDARIHELENMKRTLQTLAAHCHGDERPECPILQGLETPTAHPKRKTGFAAGSIKQRKQKQI